MPKINLDLNPSSRELLPETGLDLSGWKAEYPELIGTLTNTPPGYFALPDLDPTGLIEYADSRVGVTDDVLVLGIGGSGLGTRMLQGAFVEPLRNLPWRPRLHVVDNVDPRRLYHLLTTLDVGRTLAVTITKSGSTAETMAAYAVVRSWFEATLGEEGARRVVAVTDPARGDLRSLVETEGYDSFAVPPEVGGRFSVLSPVGLLPAALAGLDVRALLGGAALARRRCLDPAWRNNPALALALALHAHHEAGRRVVVVMPYADGLAGFAAWFAQLWAESLGKRHDYGPTPQIALGATDQHSQLQLYVDGPRDKVVWLLEVAEHGVEVSIPPDGLGYASLDYLAGRGLGELLAAERRGTTLALIRAGTPSLLTTLPRLGERELGALIFYCQAAVSICGDLARLDPYDQPGVEDGKQATYALMGRPGYEERRAADAELESRFDDGLVCRG